MLTNESRTGLFCWAGSWHFACHLFHKKWVLSTTGCLAVLARLSKPRIVNGVLEADVIDGLPEQERAQAAQVLKAQMGVSTHGGTLNHPEPVRCRREII